MDPSRDWQALSELYRSKSDGELNELAEDYASLTEVAQQVLRGEMQSRGMDDPAAPQTPKKRVQRTASNGDGEDSDGEDESGHEYTWKTPLCSCSSVQQAKQIYEVLRRAEIESWIEGGTNAWDAGGLRVVVAADELDHARELLEKPIPQDIVDEATMQAPEYEAPTCPACGAADPVLEDVEPVNKWLCETCGKQWSEGGEETESASAAEGEKAEP
jgi:ribosomal protein L37AE/L43A